MGYDMEGCAMITSVAKHPRVFSFFSFFSCTPPPLHFHWNSLLDILRIFIFPLEKKEFGLKQKEGHYICNNNYIISSFKEESLLTSELIQHLIAFILLILKMGWNESMLKLMICLNLLKQSWRYIN